MIHQAPRSVFSAPAQRAAANLPLIASALRRIAPLGRHRQCHGRVRPVGAALVISAIVSAIVGAVPSWAAPRIDNLRPHTIQSGHTRTLHLYGADLVDPQDVIFYTPGVMLRRLEAHANNHVAAHVYVAPNVPPGPVVFRVCTGSGISNMRSMVVSPFPVITDSEEAPAQASLPCALEGFLANEDRDTLEVDLVAEATVAVEVLGLRLGREFLDPKIVVHDPDGEVVAQADDTSLTQQDPYLVFVAKTTGRYSISLEDARRYGNDRYLYTMHVGHFPRPAFAWPPVGQPGNSLTVTWHGSGQPAWSQVLTLPKKVSPLHGDAFVTHVYPRDHRGPAPTPVGLRVVSAPSTEELEPNNRREDATYFASPGVVYGKIEREDDIDFYRFPAKKGQPLEIEVFARRTFRSPLDPVLQLHDAQGKRIASNDDNGSPDSFIDFNPPADGHYGLYLRDHLRHGGSNYLYQIEVTPRTPRLTIRTPDRVPFVSTPFALSRGGRMAALLVVEKRHFDAPIEWHVSDLPPGVTVDLPTLPQGRDRVPVVFQVDDQAGHRGSLVGIHGTAAVGDATVTGGFHQRTMLVRGANNRDMWGHDADRLAVAVTRAAPFSIDIVAPQVPLVQNGRMDLQVVAQRKEGFDQPIRLQMVYNPPGVYSRGSVTIPQGKTTASLPLTANGNAAQRTSPIAVTAQATHDGTPFEVSSGLTDLRVESSFFKVQFAKASVEQGASTEMQLQLERTREIPGTVTAELVGLPAGTSSEKQVVDPDATQLSFVIQAKPDARPGRFNTVLCRLVIDAAGEPITHVLGRGQLRVDKPLPPQPETSAVTARN